MYVTAALPGTRGRLKTEPEDFVVEELPAYEPSGEGTHELIEVTKRDLTTPELLRRLGRALSIRPDDIGYAGMKDRHAVTTQRLSVPAGLALEALAQIDNVLAVRSLGLHNHKLRRGHLRGNRFCIRVREAQVEHAGPILDELRRRGWANRFGQQRFGRDGDNIEGGLEILRQGKTRLPHWKRNLLVSSVQSGLFNRYLDARLEEGTFERVLPGDVCGKLPAGALFLAGPEDQPRLERFEISPTGPIFGFKMMSAEGEAGERERSVLEAAGLRLEQFKPVKAPGSRRRMRLPVDPFRLEVEGSDLLCEFELPAGSYATVLLDEFLKTGALVEEEVSST